MRVFKKVIYGILCAVDLYFTYSWIGYLVLGIKHPTIYGETNTNFMGMYIMSITFFVLFLVLSTILLVWGIRYIKARKQRKNTIEDSKGIERVDTCAKKDESMIDAKDNLSVDQNETSEIGQEKDDNENKENSEIL